MQSPIILFMKVCLLALALLVAVQGIHQTDQNDLMRFHYSIHRGEEETVTSSSFNHNGSYMLYGSKVNDTYHHLHAYSWILRVSLKIPEMFHRDHITGIEFGRNSQRVYTGSEDGTVKIWSNTDDNFPLIRTLYAPGEVYKFIINSAETRLVTVGNAINGKAKIAVFNLDTYKRIDDGDLYHTDDIFAADFNKIDTDIFATGSDDGTVAFWNVRSLRKLKQYNVRNFWTDRYDESQKDLAVKVVAFNPNSEELAYAVDTIELNEHNNFGIIYENGNVRYEGHVEGLITSMKWSPEGVRLIIGTTFLISNFLVVLDPYKDILYNVFYSNHFMGGLDVSHDGSVIVIDGINEFTLLRVKYSCEDVRYSTSEEELFECPCRRYYEWSAKRIGCF